MSKCCKNIDGSLVYLITAKPGSPPAPESLDPGKWYVERLQIEGYGPEHLAIKIDVDGIIRVDGNFKDEKKSKSFFKEYIIPDGVNNEQLEFAIYEGDKNTLVITGAIGGGAPAPAAAVAAPTTPPAPAPAQTQQVTSTSKITRTEATKIQSTYTETLEQSELEGSEDMSKEILVADKKFEAKVNVSEYHSEEVHVKISRKRVLVYTSRKETTTTTTRKEIKKVFEIPAGVKPEEITSVVDKDGTLTITGTVDEELVKQQQVQQQQTSSTTSTTSQVNEQQKKEQGQVTTSKHVAVIQQQQQVPQTNQNETVIRTRTVNTVKNVTGSDLQGVKIDKDRFEMNVDVREYKLEEVSVKIIRTRRVVTISASHKSEFESRSTHREFTLPAGAPDSNPDAIDCVLSSNGILTISGPCTPQQQPMALMDITNQNTTQQQNQQVVQQQQTQQQQVQQSHQQTSSVQKSSYTKITRRTFMSSTSMTSLDVTGSDNDPEPQPQELAAPGTVAPPLEDITDELVEDEDGNLLVQLNVKDFRAQDINVRVSKSTITVIGRKTEDVKEENKTVTRIRQFCKKIRIPADVKVTRESVSSQLDTEEGVLVIMITRNKTTTDQKQVTQAPAPAPEPQQAQPQQQQQVTESVQEQQQKQVIASTQQQQQVQQNVQSVQQTSQQTTQQMQEQKTTESVQQQQKSTESVQQVQQNVQQQQSVQQQQNVDQQSQQQVDSTQKTVTGTGTTTTTTSRRTIRTTVTTCESLKQQGYNFESATVQEYKGDPKFFERNTPIVDYKPEDLEVKIAMPWVIIEGKQEMTAENGWRSKQFTKMFTVPEGVKAENIKLELNESCDLVLCTAPIG